MCEVLIITFLVQFLMLFLMLVPKFQLLWKRCTENTADSEWLHGKVNKMEFGVTPYSDDQGHTRLYTLKEEFGL